MPRFVILEHDYPRLHWDFMLEAGEVLRSWRLARPPAAGEVVSAEPSFDHRREYLDYEGPVRGSRGRVVRWDAGTFTWREDETGRVAVELFGARARGSAVLERGPQGLWSLTLVPDA